MGPSKEPEDWEDDLLTRLRPCWEALDAAWENTRQAVYKAEDELRASLEVKEARDRRIAQVQRELEEMNLLEAGAHRELSAIQVEEIGLTEGVRRRCVKIHKKKVAEATADLEEWGRVYDKWKTKADKAARDDKFIVKFIQDLGIKAISDAVSGEFSGIGLSRIDPKYPDYEGIVYFSDFNTLDWSFNEILSVDPSFPGWKACLAECNKRKDLVFALTRIRRHLGAYFTNLINDMENAEEESGGSLNNKSSNSFLNKSSSSINSSLSKTGNNSSILFGEESV